MKVNMHFGTMMLLVSAVGLVGCGPTSSAAPDSDSHAATTTAKTSAASSATDKQDSESVTMETATFGAGCFWGVEQTYRQIEGVTETAVGYSGGKTESPSYKEVCTDRTGHAEVVQVTYDPSKVDYDKLLEVFWDAHDPTQLNHQGPDFGTQYRSVVFYHTPEQKKLAEASKTRLTESGKHDDPIVTQIEPAQTFYRAEEYHQQYLTKRGLTSCSTTIKK